MSSKRPLRTARETAARILGLASACVVADDEAMRLVIVEWLRMEGLWQTLSPKEQAFLEATAATEQDTINFSWGSEAIYFLGWALGLIETLDPPSEQASTGEILDQVPAPGESVEEYLQLARLRSGTVIHQAAEDLYHAHAWCCSARAFDKKERHGFDIEVAMERLRAANWLVCYEDAEWDVVPTDA